MANYSSIRSKKLDISKCLGYLQDINNKFGNVFTLHENEGYIELVHSKKSYIKFAFYIHDNIMEWKTYSNDEIFWYAETFASKLIRLINPRLRIKNEGIDESIEPTFDKEYPTLKDWTKKYSLLGVFQS